MELKFGKGQVMNFRSQPSARHTLPFAGIQSHLCSGAKQTIFGISILSFQL
jgi:hypothetical protein